MEVLRNKSNLQNGRSSVGYEYVLHNGHGYIVMYDLGIKGCVPITVDFPDVYTDMLEVAPGIKSARMIYKDIQGYFEAIICTKGAARSMNFDIVSLDYTTDLEDALKKYEKNV